MSESMSSQLVEDAFNAAVSSRKVRSGLLHHSDRGVQYTSARFASCWRPAASPRA